jgi:hypothetical protein
MVARQKNSVDFNLGERSSVVLRVDVGQGMPHRGGGQK